MKDYRRVFPFILACIVSACGFHLRGMLDLPPWLNNVAIVIEEGNRELEPLIKKQLRSYNIRIADNLLTASYVLTIEHDNIQKNIVSISSSTTPRQYQLIYSVQFKLENANAKVILPSSQTTSTRQITINSDRILGSTDEEERFKSEMRQEASIQILNRLSSAKL